MMVGKGKMDKSRILAGLLDIVDGVSRFEGDILVSGMWNGR